MAASTTAAGRRPPRSERLGPWIGLPLLGLAFIGLLFAVLPEGACDETASEDVWAWIIFSFGAGLAVGCLIAAAQRVVRLLRRPGGVPRRQLGLTLAALAILAVVGTTLSIEGAPGFYWHAWAVAVPATGLALLALTVLALRRRRPDDAGLLLPAYLLGAGLFVFPSLALITALIKSDALCS